ncbi:MAG TPA: wax ester/triacylglycerol synthase family O-acyltransferase [Myxococcota bacterium]|nr:wax ester/triacylglycerol synthase family O-acyltransferase [Myxococcota bacterium]
MAARSYERLSAQDSSFILFEGPGTHMHVSAVAIFEAGPLRKPDGGLDIERLRDYVASRLHLLPRYRKRLQFTPLQHHPIWVDDPHFNLSYHVRHTALPAPGSDEQLKEFAGRVLSQQLDREKPLWEIWFVEGLARDRFALVSKVHHSMADGITGTALMYALLGATPEKAIEDAPHWQPQPPPHKLALAADEIERAAGVPFAALRALRDSLRHPRRAAASLADGALAIWQALDAGLRVPSSTPFNQPIGTHRRVDWCTLDLAAIKGVKKRLDGTVNDVLLTIATGAMRRFLGKRRVALDDLELRVVVPVSMRRGEEDHGLANRVSAWFIRLPISEPDPLAQFAAVRSETRQLRESKAAQGMDLFLRFSDWSGSDQLTLWAMRLASTVRLYNLVVTNVPGPQRPLYLLGARLEAVYPQIPLLVKQGLAIAVMSYCGKVCFGLIGDWDLVPDLPVLARSIESSFGELQTAAQAR